MEPTREIRDRLKDLCASQKLAVVATHCGGQPYASLVAFVASDDLRDIFFVTARTTRKFANLTKDSRVAVLINSSTNAESDFHEAVSITATESREAGRIFMLPAQKWARRISGVYGNALAVAAPAQAHAVLTAKPDGGYVVSVRAPLAARFGADELCSQFDTGGGRKGAAGINHLPESELGRFIATFYAVFSRS